jgi:hypothetical protein
MGVEKNIYAWIIKALIYLKNGSLLLHIPERLVYRIALFLEGFIVGWYSR